MSSVLASIQNYLPAAGFFLLPYASNGLSWFVFIKNKLRNEPERDEWWLNLKYPSWAPPEWVFAPVWGAIFASWGVASYMVFRHGGFEAQALPLAMYGVNLLFSCSWSVFYFGYRRLDLVCLIILCIIICIVIHISEYYTYIIISKY